MIIRQTAQDVGQEEASQARVPDLVLQLGQYPNATERKNLAAQILEKCKNRDVESDKKGKSGLKELVSVRDFEFKFRVWRSRVRFGGYG